MSTTVTRKHKTKDVEMLTATATIIENAIANYFSPLINRSDILNFK
ncbi:hypothetical protein JE952_002410 [Flavobacterium psychrophilum]|nr:hypothetical protein [Flavobacterium psychrophilum]EKT4550754.1 hypothetical protein [Flavobacterium psychrophilum]ELM3645129.1 hypothetical protein [Flavobacterium psychrophilum]